ncbi:MAG: aminomethyl-transferring glycine dehydrogenase subunit GcvPA [Gammaproteobacteria bacterium]|nr:aminomethyl-transferring glycine dehydrogenase subunit GcvPA [Gammaproteobacteria bacterium]
MPFIPHTDQEIAQMLKTIGADSIDDLFDEIPAHLRAAVMSSIPAGMTEMEISRLMRERADKNTKALCFLGAGSYQHHIPAAVWEITTRGEFYSAYTPYQAEASQGTLQLTYEYQSMMTALTAMDVSNASMYDGASSLAEAILMAVRANRKSKSRKILMPTTVNPVYRQTAHTIVKGQQIELVDVAYDETTGTVSLDQIKQQAEGDITAIVLQQPNFFGCLEDVDAITDWAHENNILLIAVVNPLTMAVLNPPGEWGSADSDAKNKGADIACGDGQPLGAPMSAGGPYYGLLCCRQSLVRQMPGRIVGRTVDLDGKEGFVLTLQAREQHIRRSKATSNICTNQGLVVTASTIYMSIMGAKGLENTAAACHANNNHLVEKLTAITDVKQIFSGAHFHETVLQLIVPASEVLSGLMEKDILGGYDLSLHYPELGNAILVCTTEMRSEDDINAYVKALQEVLNSLSGSADSKVTTLPETA